MADVHVSRRHLALAAGTTTVDTGLEIHSNGYPGPPGNATVPSRVQVIPLSPISGWTGVTHADPTYDAVTGVISVAFTAADNTDINVLFWLPHSINAVLADDYAPCEIIEVGGGEGCIVANGGS